LYKKGASTIQVLIRRDYIE